MTGTRSGSESGSYHEFPMIQFPGMFIKACHGFYSLGTKDVAVAVASLRSDDVDVARGGGYQQ